MLSAGIAKEVPPWQQNVIAFQMDFHLFSDKYFL